MITAIHYISRDPRWELTTPQNSYNEGDTVVFNLTTYGVDEPGKNLRWVVDREEDIDPSLAYGNFILDEDSNATWQFGALADYITEGQETLNISVIDIGPEDGMDQAEMAAYDLSGYEVYASHSIIIEDTTQSYSLATGTSVITSDIACHGGTTGMGVYPTSGIPPYQWAWTRDPSTTVIGTEEYMDGLTAGTYNCYVNDSRGVGHMFTRTFTEPSEITITVSNVTPSSLTFNVSGGTPGYTVTADSGMGNPTVNGNSYTYNNLSPGVTYGFYVTDDNECSRNKKGTTTYNPFEIIGNNNAIIPCYGGTSGSTGISVTVSGGSGNHSISWVDSSSTAYSRNNLTALTYVATVTDSVTGETDTTSFVVSQPSGIETFGIATDTTISITPSGGTEPYSIVWSDSNSITSFNRSGLTPNTDYYYTVSDGNGCSTQTAVIYTEPCADTPLEASALIENQNCPGENGSIGITSNYPAASLSFAWSNGASTKVISAQPGEYSCTVTHTTGCGGSVLLEGLIIGPSTLPTPGVSVTSTSIQVSVIGHPSTITWSGSNSTSFQRIGLTPNTTYDYTINQYYDDCEDCYCVVNGSATTLQQSNYGFYISSGVESDSTGFCSGDTAITTPFWSNGSNINSLLGSSIYTNSSGSSTLIGYDQYYLVSSTSTTISTSDVSLYRIIRVNNSGIVTSEGNASSCPIPIAPDPLTIEASNPTSNSITVEASGGTGPYTYTLQGSGTTYSNQTGSVTFIGLNPSTTYNFTVTDSNGNSANINGTTFHGPISITKFELTVDQDCYHYGDYPLTPYGEIKVEWEGGDQGKMELLRLWRSIPDINGDNWTSHYSINDTAPGVFSHTFTGLTHGIYDLEIRYVIPNGNKTETRGSVDGVSEIRINQPDHWLVGPYTVPNGIVVDIGDTPWEFAFPLTVKVLDGNDVKGSKQLTTKVVQNPIGSMDEYAQNNPGSVAYFKNLDPDKTYIVRAIDNTGCVYEVEETPPPPPLTISRFNGSKGFDCPSAGNNGQLYVNVTSGVQPYTYELYRDGSRVPDHELTLTGSLFSNLEPGSYTVIVSDDAGQTISPTDTYTYSHHLTPNISGNGGGSTTWSVSASPGSTIHYGEAGGDFPHSISIDSSDAYVINNLTPTIQYSAYSLSGYNCQSSMINYTPSCETSINLNVSIQDVTCNGSNNGSATANNSVAGAIEYIWKDSSGITIGESKTVSDLSPGNYTVTVKTYGGLCEYQESISIIEPSILTTDTESVDYFEATVRATGGVGPYTYTFEGTTYSNESAEVTFTGLDHSTEYTYSVVDSNGCNVEDTFTTGILELYTWYTSPNTLDTYAPANAESYCDLYSDVYTTQSVRSTHQSAFQMDGDYLRNSSGQIISYGNETKIAISNEYAANVKEGSPVSSHVLTFGPGGIITSVEVIACDLNGGGTGPGSGDPFLKNDDGGMQ